MLLVFSSQHGTRRELLFPREAGTATSLMPACLEHPEEVPQAVVCIAQARLLLLPGPFIAGTCTQDDFERPAPGRGQPRAHAKQPGANTWSVPRASSPVSAKLLACAVVPGESLWQKQ